MAHNSLAIGKNKPNNRKAQSGKLKTFGVAPKLDAPMSSNCRAVAVGALGMCQT